MNAPARPPARVLRIADASAVPVPAARDPSRPVVLVGFIRQGNLGIGYLSAVLRRQGYTVLLVDIEDDADAQVRQIADARPLLVGFSLIFQFYLPRFHELMARLRDAGVTAHFTMGGHFASLSPHPALDLLPALDSVVRFEGEGTLLALADRLGTGADWRAEPGISWRDADGRAVDNPLRHLVHDLDDLPWPDRLPLHQHRHRILGLPVFQMLASRGCARTCSFCSIQTFYRAAPGKVVRTRQPAQVVAEMRHLYDHHDARIFLFQDDDFPLVGKVWRRWAHELVQALHDADLAGRIIWKISCRVDAVEPELLARMRDAGLYLVYMGIESGNDEGLEVLNKEVDVEQNLAAVRVLRELGIEVAFGFMMFDPSTQFASVRANLDFLRRIVGTHENAASFCRMVPYDGTPIKDELQRQGRLKGDVCDPDYDFLDPRLDGLFHDLQRLTGLGGWTHGQRALTPALETAWIELAVVRRLYPAARGMAVYRQALRSLTRQSNDLLLDMVGEACDAHEAGQPHRWTPERVAARTQKLLTRVLALRDGFVARNQDLLGRRPDLPAVRALPPGAVAAAAAAHPGATTPTAPKAAPAR